MQISSQILIIIVLTLTLGCSDDTHTYFAFKNYWKQSSKSALYDESKPYRVFLDKGNYVVESIPYKTVNYGQGELCSGVTKVYSLPGDSLIYTVDRYFVLDHTFFSNDGKRIVYINDYLRGTDYDSCTTSLIEFYQDGMVEQSYYFEDLFGRSADDNEFNWLYHEKELNEWFFKNNHYLVNDNIYVISGINGVVFIFDMNTNELVEKVDTATFQDNLTLVDFERNFVKFIPLEEAKLFPDLKNGNSFRSELAKEVDVDLIPVNSDKSTDRYYYRIDLEVLIDSLGNTIHNRVSSSEYVLTEKANKIKESISDFLSKSTFDIDTIPYNLQEWLFEDKFYIARNPISLSIDDKQEYENRVCQIDSLRGTYIPKDLSDAHSELNKILDNEAKEMIVKGESTHFGLGMWLRNNWGLWSGGRLKCYFDERELYHPDHISSLILGTYRMKLLNESFNQDSLILEASNAEKEWMND